MRPSRWGHFLRRQWRDSRGRRAQLARGTTQLAEGQRHHTQGRAKRGGNPAGVKGGSTQTKGSITGVNPRGKIPQRAVKKADVRAEEETSLWGITDLVQHATSKLAFFNYQILGPGTKTNYQLTIAAPLQSALLPLFDFSTLAAVHVVCCKLSDLHC